MFAVRLFRRELSIGLLVVACLLGLTSRSGAAVTNLVQVPPIWTQFAGSPTDSVRSDDIYFIDQNTGWASRNNKIYKTINGGTTWTLQATITGAHFRSISFLTATHGFAGNLGVGSYDGNVSNTNVLYETLDGGSTWHVFPGLSEQGMKGFCAMSVLDSNHIYGGGRVRSPAFFVKSEDGGTNWTATNLTAAGVMNAIMDVYFQDTNNGWLCGMDTNAYNTTCTSPSYHGAIAHTTDGGKTWTQVVNSQLDCSYFWKLAWPSPQVGYCSLQQNASSYDHVIFYKTVDGGQTWVSNGIPQSAFGGSGTFYIQGIGFVSTNVGWVGGASGLSDVDTFLGTTNGGASWFPAGYTLTSFINRIRFKASDFGFASGYRLHLYHSPLAITNQTASLAAMGGDSPQFQIGVYALSKAGYQWQKNGTNISSATNTVLNLTNVTRADEAIYTATVTNSYGAIISSNINLRVYVPQRFGRPQILSNGSWRFVFGDNDGSAISSNNLANFELDASYDLTNWQSLNLPFYLTNGMIQVDDATNYPERFYRVIEH